MASPLCLLLLPRTLEQFILRDQAEDLLRAPGVVAVEAGRLGPGALARLPGAVADRLVAGQAARLVRGLPGTPKVVVIFHPLQLGLAEAVLARAGDDAELWYSRWDRYEVALDADAGQRARLLELHERAAARAELIFAASDPLVRLEAESGREATLVPLAADRFPAPAIDGTVVAVCLGHLGRRTDWGLLRAVAETMGDRLVALMVGVRHDDECAGDADFAAVCAMDQFVWLGGRSDAEASRLTLAAAVGFVPFTVEPFNDAGLPYRILKYARLGRRTVSPDLAGVRTWARAVDVAPDAASFAAALTAAAVAGPDATLRTWALAQTAEAQNAPLWTRLRQLGVACDP